MADKSRRYCPRSLTRSRALLSTKVVGVYEMAHTERELVAHMDPTAIGLRPKISEGLAVCVFGRVGLDPPGFSYLVQSTETKRPGPGNSASCLI